MGRTLDALQHRNPVKPLSQGGNGVAKVEPVEAIDQAEQGLDGEVPFIEVGGPDLVGSGSAAPTVAAGRRNQLGSPRLESDSRAQDGNWLRGSDGSVSTLTVRFQPRGTSEAGTPGSTKAPQSELVTFHQPHHALSDQYNAVLRAIQSQVTLPGPQVIGVAGVGSGTGTTTIFLNLAVAWARASQRPVGVVELNLRRPAGADRLGIAAEPGFWDFLRGRIPLGRAFQETAQANLFMLPAGKGPSSQEDWPSFQSVQDSLRSLRGHFGLVLVEGPSWDRGPELAGVIPACDAFYLVVRPEELETPPVSELSRLVPHLGGYLGGYIVANW
jgi:Mrp family chromosome partitioning ATPase